MVEHSIDQYIRVDATNNRSEQNVDSEGVGVKLRREADLLGTALGAGFVDAAKEAAKNPVETGVKLGGSFAVGLGLGFLRGRGSFIPQALGTAFTISFINDLMPRLGSLGNAMSDTWASGANLNEHKATMKETLGQFVFDTALMSAGGIAGGATSRISSVDSGWGNFRSRFPYRAYSHENKLWTRLYNHDPEMAFHSQRVAEFSGLIAKQMGLPRVDIVKAKHAGLGHDMGKLNISRDLLTQTTQLTPQQRTIINRHPTDTEHFLSAVPYNRRLQDVPRIAGQHHEYLDGTGYPNHVAANQLSTPARIVAVADKFDAMSGPRSYQAALRPWQVEQTLWREVAGNHIDGKIVAALFSLPAEQMYTIAQIGRQRIPDSALRSLRGNTMSQVSEASRLSGAGQPAVATNSMEIPELVSIARGK